MSNIREELTQLISSLNNEKFRSLVQVFLKKKYRTKEVYIVDGPYDGGNDLEIKINDRVIKRNIQITVQKDSIEKKIKEDLEKSKSNVTKYSYLKTLDFYYNQKLTHSKVNEFRLMAEVDYEMELNIYDANNIAQDIENDTELKNHLFQLLNIKSNGEFVKIDKQTKVLFDMLSNAQETGEVKKQFIHSFIFTFLYENPGSTIEVILEGVSKKLSDVTDIKFYRDTLSALKSKGIITTDETRKQFSLSIEKSKEITDIYEQSLIQEAQLKTSVELVLKPYALEHIAPDLASFLNETYKENYKIDLDELSCNNLSINSSIKKIYLELRTFLKNKGLDDDNCDILAQELFKTCSENEYLNKIGASMLFANLYESNKLDDYLNNRQQDCYLDTQILLRLLCYQYKDTEFNDIAYQAVKNLYETIKKNNTRKVTLNTSFDYLAEVAGHMQEALRLQRFFSLPMFRHFKNSKNVFFNYYFYLRKIDLLEEDITLEEFLSDLLGITMPSFNSPDFSYVVANRLKAMYEVLQINIIFHPMYEHFQVFKKEYETILAYEDKYRSPTAIDNDIKTIIYLSDVNKHLDEKLGLRSEPFLVTWDKVFYEFRKTVMKKFQSYGYGYWYIYSPAKLADRLSVMNFKLNPKSIDYNIISLTETNVNLIFKDSTFLDILSYFFEREDLSELELANKILDLESKNRKTNEKPESEEMSEGTTPLLEVLMSLRKQYTSDSEKYHFNDLIELFENKNFETRIFDALTKAVDLYKKQRDKKNVPVNQVYSSFDSLIEINKKEKEAAEMKQDLQ